MSRKEQNSIISNTAKHIQIANIVREQILNGDFTPGTRLCSDEELAVQYGVHRHTVAEGLKTLAGEGLLERAPRRGSIVTGIHKEPVYLLMACPGFLDENNNSAVFVRRLYKNLHLQLMDKGISVITVPMSPTNNPDDISEKYFDIIPHGAKVVCIGEWGLQGLDCLNEKKCNVVFYDFQNMKRSKLVGPEWKKIVFDRAYGADMAIKYLLSNKFKRPLLVFSRRLSVTGRVPQVKKALELQAEYYPALPEENILWCNKGECGESMTEKLDFDSLYFSDVHLAEDFINGAGIRAKGIISNDITEIISALDLCYCAFDSEKLARMTIELFIQSDGTEKIIKPELYNTEALHKSPEAH